MVFANEVGFTRNDMLNVHNMYIWSDINLHSTVQSRHHQQFSITVWAGTVGAFFLGSYIFPALFTVIFWNKLCQSYWTLHCWMFDETYGSCMMVLQPISVTPPEITLSLPTLGGG
jgi:hypothetical protein